MPAARPGCVIQVQAIALKGVVEHDRTDRPKEYRYFPNKVWENVSQEIGRNSSV